jgi:hypothetical protein
MPARVTYPAPAETWSYVLRSDRELPLEQQSRFVLRPLTQAERLQGVDALVHTRTESGGAILQVGRSAQVARDFALSHIVSTQNFPSDGPRPWPADGSLSERSSYLEMLSDDHVSELGNEIWTRSSLAKSEEAALKNSSRPGVISDSGNPSTTIPSSIPAGPAIETPS